MFRRHLHHKGLQFLKASIQMFFVFALNLNNLEKWKSNLPEGQEAMECMCE